MDGLALIEASQQRIRSLAETCGDAAVPPEQLEVSLANLLIELHVVVILESEFLVPTLDAIAEELGTDEPMRLRRSHRDLRANLIAVALSETFGEQPTDGLWAELLGAALRHARSHERTFLPLAARWLDPPSRETLGQLLRDRRKELESEIKQSLG